MGSDPKTEEGPGERAILRLTGAQLASIDPPIGPEWFVDWDETAEFVERDPAARLVSPADREEPYPEGWDAVARVEADLLEGLRAEAATSGGNPSTPDRIIDFLRPAYLPELVRLARLGQREDAPLDVERLAEAIWESSDNSEEGPWIDATPDQRSTALDWSREIAAEYARLRESKP